MQTSIIEIPNQQKNTIRADINEMLKSAITLNSGSVEPVPSPTGSNPKSAPNMTWDDTNN